MLKELIALANNLDEKGFSKEADIIDSIIKKAESDWDEDEDEFMDDEEYERSRLLGRLKSNQREIKEMERAIDELSREEDTSNPQWYEDMARLLRIKEDLISDTDRSSQEQEWNRYDRMDIFEQQEYDADNARQDRHDAFRREY